VSAALDLFTILAVSAGVLFFLAGVVGLLRFPDPTPGAAEVDHDAFTDTVIAAIVRGGKIFVGGTTWRGRRCMRISVCNWRTGEAEVAVGIEAVAEALAAVQP